MSLEKECKHELVFKIGEQDNGDGTMFEIASCYYCKATIDMSEGYQQTVMEVYEKVKEE